VTSGSGTAHHGSSLRDYLQVVRRHKWLVLTAAIVVPVAAAAFSLRQPAEYRSSADVLLSRQNLAAALTGTPDATAAGDANRVTSTQAELARVPAVAQAVLAAVRLRDRSVAAFLAQSSVGAAADADILTFTVTDRDPATAAKLATAYAHEYTRYRLKFDTASLEAARSEVAARIGELQAKKGSLYETLVEKEQTLSTMEALQTSNASVVRPAGAAVQIAPRPLRNGVFGLVLGLFLGIGLAFVRQALDTRVRSTDEIRDRLDLPLLARLAEPPRRLRSADRLTMLAEPSSTEAEGYRMLRTNLEFAALGEDVRTIMVTSAVEQEGKSTTVANLGVALARAGQRVVIADLDLRRPFIERFFGLEARPGVTQVALGLLDLDEALVEITLDERSQLTQGRLEILPAGAMPRDPGELVSSDRLTEILMGLGRRADVVLVDTPPLFHVGDALVLSAKVDAVVVVARMDVVRRPMLAELRRLLESMPVLKLGVVVTGAQADDGYGAYGYGYSDARPYGRRARDEARR
jgi:succinoglycan biosynthesis transport protein ExoP